MKPEERLKKLRVLAAYLEKQLEEGGVSEPARVASQYRQTLSEIDALERISTGDKTERCRCLDIATALNAAYEESGTHLDHRIDWVAAISSADFMDRVVSYLNGTGRLLQLQARVAARRAGEKVR